MQCPVCKEVNLSMADRQGIETGYVLSQPAPQPDPKMDNADDLERWRQMPMLRLTHGSGAGARRQEAALLAPLADAWIAENLNKLRR